MPPWRPSPCAWQQQGQRHVAMCVPGGSNVSLICRASLAAKPPPSPQLPHPDLASPSSFSALVASRSLPLLMGSLKTRLKTDGLSRTLGATKDSRAATGGGNTLHHIARPHFQASHFLFPPA